MCSGVRFEFKPQLPTCELCELVRLLNVSAPRSSPAGCLLRWRRPFWGQRHVGSEPGPRQAGLRATCAAALPRPQTYGDELD